MSWYLVHIIYTMKALICACHLFCWRQHFLLTSSHFFVRRDRLPKKWVLLKMQSLLNEKRFWSSVFTIVKLKRCSLTYVTVFLLAFQVLSELHHKHDPNSKIFADNWHLLLYDVITKFSIFLMVNRKNLLILISGQKIKSKYQETKKLLKFLFLTI